MNPSDIIESLAAQSARVDLLQLLFCHSNIVINLVHEGGALISNNYIPCYHADVKVTWISSKAVGDTAGPYGYL